MRYNNAYFRIPLLDTAYGIIANGDEVTAYHKGGNTPLVIRNDIGVAVILPVRYENVNPEDNGNTVIEIDETMKTDI